MGQSALDLAHVAPVRIGGLVIEPGLRIARRTDGESVRLEPQVIRVLLALAEADGAILSRADLVERCWQGRAISADAIDRVIARLRRLGREFAGDSFAVETVPRVGYRLHQEPMPGEEPTQPRRRAMLLGALAAGSGLIAAGGAWWAIKNEAGPSGGVPATIAVLPFALLGGGAMPAYLGRGLARELQQTLTRIAGIRVIAELSSFSLAERGLDLREIGKRLGADLLVTGELRRAGDTLVASQTLVNATDQTVLWTSSANGSLADIPSLNTKLAGALVQRIVEHVGSSAVRTDLPPPRRIDGRAFPLLVEAEEALMRCRALLAEKRMAQGHAAGDLACRRAEQVLDLDPRNVRALFVLWTLARNGYSPALERTRPERLDRAGFALSFIHRALVADPNDPIALTALADHLRRFEWRWAEAEAQLKRAIAAAPGLVEARYCYANLLGTLGRAVEGVEQARELVRIDPENGWRRGFSLPRLEYLAGAREQAIQDYFVQFRQTPGSVFYATELYLTYLAEGSAPDLLRLADQLRRGAQGGGAPSPEMRARIDRIDAAADALNGDPSRFAAMIDADAAGLDDLTETDAGRRANDQLFILALEYAAAARPTQALDTLERALAARSLAWPASLPFGPARWPRAVRGDPRYAAIWRSDSRLKTLLAARRQNLLARQRAGTLPDGRHVVRG